jgi:hypothetical protein
VSQEIEPSPHRFRTRVPDDHRASLDTRLAWLWNQRFGTVQQVWQSSKDVLDHTAATLILQAIFAKDLDAISQVFQRIEGSPLYAEEIEDEAKAGTTRI